MSSKKISKAKETANIKNEKYFIDRETKMARRLIDEGVTAIRKANYTDDGIESYYLAFFLLSAGLERLSKLVVILDRSLNVVGPLTASRWVKGFNHNIENLCMEMNQITSKRKIELEYEYPDNSITRAIIRNIDAFAKGGAGRYANYACIENPQNDSNEPIRKWWNEVGLEILNSHFQNRGIQKIIEGHEKDIERVMGSSTMPVIVDETGNRISSASCAFSRSAKAAIVQDWTPFYTLSIVRWISNLYYELSKTISTHKRKETFNESCDCFQVYIVNDRALRNFKI